MGYSELLSERIGLFHTKPLPCELSGPWILGPTGSVTSRENGTLPRQGSVVRDWGTQQDWDVSCLQHGSLSLLSLWLTAHIPSLSHRSCSSLCFPVTPGTTTVHVLLSQSPFNPRQPADVWWCFLPWGGFLLWPLKFVFISKGWAFFWLLFLVYLGVCSCNQEREGSESGGLCAGSGMKVPPVSGGGGGRLESHWLTQNSGRCVVTMTTVFRLSSSQSIKRQLVISCKIRPNNCTFDSPEWVFRVFYSHQFWVYHENMEVVKGEF